MEEYIYLKRQIYDGAQRLYKFPNGYGASVVRHSGSYGYEEGLWELAVIKWDGDRYHLCYDTPITDDVIGYLDEDQIEKILIDIKNLT